MDLYIVASPVVLLIFNLFIFHMANKTVKIIRNNNLFNEQTQIFFIFNMFFAANVGGSELVFYMCSCWQCRWGSDHNWLNSRLWLLFRFFWSRGIWSSQWIMCLKNILCWNKDGYLITKSLVVLYFTWCKSA